VFDYRLKTGVRSPAGTDILPAAASKLALVATQPHIWVLGGPSPEGKARLGGDADCSPPSSTRIYKSRPPSTHMACCGTALLFRLNNLPISSLIHVAIFKCCFKCSSFRRTLNLDLTFFSTLHSWSRWQLDLLTNTDISKTSFLIACNYFLVL
jgi:hypothetical protein